MTAVPLAAPRRPRSLRPTDRRLARAAGRRGRPSRAVEALAPARRRPAARPVSLGGCRPAQRSALRLTRRGRLVITAALTAAGIGVTLFTGTVSLAGTATEHPPVRYVTVAPGDTLWSIAGEAAPGVDRRDTVHRIVDLNALRDAQLSVGQLVAVPVG
jgi:Tfp pilus assembly protein FimV